MSLTEGKLVNYAIEEVVKTLETIETFTDMAQTYNQSGRDLQRGNNTWWKPIEQQSRTQDGWDITGNEDGIIELSIQGNLGDPSNAYFGLRADDVRDETSYRRKIQSYAKRLVGEVEERGLERAVKGGAFAVTDSNAIGSTNFTLWDALGAAEDKMYDLEYAKSKGVCAWLNSADYRAGGKELTQSTANYSGKLPDDAYNKGLLQQQVSGISNVYKHNRLPVMTAQSVVLTVNGAQTFAPISTEVSPSGTEVPFDNRFATLTVTGTAASVNIGDKFSIAGMKAVSRDGKIESGDDMTFSVQAINGQVLTISPRPYAWDERPVADGGSGVLSRDEAAYSNVSTAFNNADTLVWLNTTAGKANVIMTKDAMVLASSPIPTDHELFADLRTKSFSAGKINGIIGFESSLGSLTGQCRIAIWYDWQIEKPEEIGILMGGQV